MIDRTNAERQRRYIARLKAQAGRASVSNADPKAGVSNTNAKADVSNAALVQALAQAKARIAQFEARAPAPDGEVARLKAQIKALNASYFRDVAEGVRHRDMDRETFNAIAKCLHPDRAPTAAERAAACKLFTQWKANRDKAQKLFKKDQQP